MLVLKKNSVKFKISLQKKSVKIKKKCRRYLARASAPTASQAWASAGAAGLVRACVIAAALESGHRHRPQAEHIADGETLPVPDLADCNLSDTMVVVDDLP